MLVVRLVILALLLVQPLPANAMEKRVVLLVGPGDAALRSTLELACRSQLSDLRVGLQTLPQDLRRPRLELVDDLSSAKGVLLVVWLEREGPRTRLYLAQSDRLFARSIGEQTPRGAIEAGRPGSSPPARAEAS